MLSALPMLLHTHALETALPRWILAYGVRQTPLAHNNTVEGIAYATPDFAMSSNRICLHNISKYSGICLVLL